MASPANQQLLPHSPGRGKNRGRDLTFKELLWPSELIDHRDAKDLEGGRVLAGDREGFELTKLNQRVRYIHEEGDAIPALDSGTYQDFDMCYVFPKAQKNPEKEMTAQEVKKQLLNICRARVGRNLDELNRVAKLHPVYGLGASISSGMTRGQFDQMIRSMFFRVLEHIGAIYYVEKGQDKHERDFVKVRLSEKGCTVIADYKKYPLQIDRECTRYREFRNDPEFTPPYMPYEKYIEDSAAAAFSAGIVGGGNTPPTVPGTPTAPATAGGRVWQRYDRISRHLGASALNSSAKDGTRAAAAVRAGGLNLRSDPEASIFREVDRIRLLNMAISEFVNVDELIRNKWMFKKFVLAQPATVKSLVQNWANFPSVFTWNQPLDEVRSYFGEEIAMYFCWLGFYCKALLLPAIVGVVLTTINLVWNRKLSYDHPIVNVSRLIYCIFIASWCCFFYALWRRRERYFSLRWGIEAATVARVAGEENPFFKHDRFITDPVQPDKFARYFSPTKYRVRRLITFLFTAITCAIVIFLVNDDINDACARLMGYHDYAGIRDWVRIVGSNESLVQQAAKIALVTALMIKVYNALFSSMIVWRLGEFENHQYMADYNNSTASKLFIFKCAGYLTVLFYLAFFKEYINPCDETHDGRCLPRLAKQLVLFYLVDLATDVLEIGMPFVTYTITKVLAKPKSTMPKYQYQAYLKPYERTAGLTADYMSKIIQFGYTALFSMAVPALPTFGFIVNMVEIRTDAFKLCHVTQRPFPHLVDGIGLWDDLQRAMTFFGVLSNVLLCTFATVGHGHDLVTKLSASLVLMLAALALKDLIEFRLPSESSRYKLLKARMQVVDYEAIWNALADGK